MTHLDEGTIQALLHGELADAEREAADGHAAACADCRSRVEGARAANDWVLARLAVLDTAAPAATLAHVRKAGARRATMRLWRLAATIALIAGGAGTAWSLPSVRALVLGVLRRTPAAIPPLVPPAEPLEVPPAVEAPSSGIAVVPGAHFVIQFEGAPAGRGGLRVRLTDRPDVSVVSRGSRVAFESREGLVLVRSAGATADFEVEVPSTAPWVEVRAGRRELFRRRGMGIEAAGPLGADGWYVIELRGGVGPGS